MSHIPKNNQEHAQALVWLRMLRHLCLMHGGNGDFQAQFDPPDHEGKNFWQMRFKSRQTTREVWLRGVFLEPPKKPADDVYDDGYPKTPGGFE